MHNVNASLYIQGSKSPQRVKNQGKSDKTFFFTLILHSEDNKLRLYLFSSSRTRVCARLPTAMLFFCCHKCHTSFFSLLILGGFSPHIRHTISTPLNDFLRNKGSQTVKENNKTSITLSFTTLQAKSCDTCDRKKSKIPVTRARGNKETAHLHLLVLQNR